MAKGSPLLPEMDEDSRRIAILAILIVLVLWLPRQTSEPPPELEVRTSKTGTVPKPSGPKHRIARVAYRAPEASDLGRRMELWGPTEMTRVLHLGLKEGQVWGSDDLLGDPAQLAKTYRGAAFASQREAQAESELYGTETSQNPSGDLRRSLSALERGQFGTRRGRGSGSDSQSGGYLLDPRIRGFRPGSSGSREANRTSGSSSRGPGSSASAEDGSLGDSSPTQRSQGGNGEGSGELPPPRMASVAPGWGTWSARPLPNDTSGAKEAPRDVLPRGDRR